jgi:hypothetical protein
VTFKLGDGLASRFAVLIDDLGGVICFRVRVGDYFVEDAGLIGSFMEEVRILFY